MKVKLTYRGLMYNAVAKVNGISFRGPLVSLNTRLMQYRNQTFRIVVIRSKNNENN